MDSFICDSPIEGSACDADDDEGEEVNEMAIYRRSMLSQAAARPANFRTPQRRIPNQYKMRFVTHTPDSAASSLELSAPSSPSVSVASSAAPSPPPAMVRRLNFNLSSDEVKDTGQQGGEEPGEEEDADDSLLLWCPTSKKAQRGTAPPKGTPDDLCWPENQEPNGCM